MEEWLNTKQVSSIAHCGRDKARAIIREVNDEAQAKGYRIPKSSEAYRERVLEKLGLKENK